MPQVYGGKAKTLRAWSAFILAVAVGASCSAGGSSAALDGIDHLLDSLATEHGVPGYAFAAFDDRRILHQRAAGVKSKDTGETVDVETVFEAASISKPMFAYMVLTLARDGVLDHDAPLGVTPPVRTTLGHDERSAVLTPRMLLAHLGGLPNWRSRINFEATNYEELFGPNDTLQFVAAPGTEYRYSGEGYVLLQQVVEHATGRALNSLAQEMVFDPLEMPRSSFLFDDAMQANAASGHHRDARADKWVISMALASSTLHTTAPDLAAFGIHLASDIRRGAYYAALSEPAASLATRDDWAVSWGLGLGIATRGDSTYMFHGGNNVIFIADFIYGFEENLGYALLTNSANGQAMVEAVEGHVFGRPIPRR